MARPCFFRHPRNRLAQAPQVGGGLLHRGAHPGADLDLRAQEFRRDLGAEQVLTLCEQGLRRIGGEVQGLPVDQEILLFDADGEAGFAQRHGAILLRPLGRGQTVEGGLQRVADDPGPSHRARGIGNQILADFDQQVRQAPQFAVAVHRVAEIVAGAVGLVVADRDVAARRQRRHEGQGDPAVPVPQRADMQGRDRPSNSGVKLWMETKAWKGGSRSRFRSRSISAW